MQKQHKALMDESDSDLNDDELLLCMCIIKCK